MPLLTITRTHDPALIAVLVAAVTLALAVARTRPDDPELVAAAARLIETVGAAMDHIGGAP